MDNVVEPLWGVIIDITCLRNWPGDEVCGERRGRGRGESPPCSGGGRGSPGLGGASSGCGEQGVTTPVPAGRAAGLSWIGTPHSNGLGQDRTAAGHPGAARPTHHITVTASNN